MFVKLFCKNLRLGWGDGILNKNFLIKEKGIEIKINALNRMQFYFDVLWDILFVKR